MILFFLSFFLVVIIIIFSLILTEVHSFESRNGVYDLPGFFGRGGGIEEDVGTRKFLEFRDVNVVVVCTWRM